MIYFGKFFGISQEPWRLERAAPAGDGSRPHGAAAEGYDTRVREWGVGDFEARVNLKGWANREARELLGRESMC